MERQKLKLNSALRGYPAGAVIDVELNSDGAPVDAYWRRRLKDAMSDNCVEFVYDNKPGGSAKADQDKAGKPKKNENKEE